MGESSNELRDVNLVSISEPTITAPSTTTSSTTELPTLPVGENQLSSSQSSERSWPIIELAIMTVAFLACFSILCVCKFRCKKPAEFKVMEALWEEEAATKNAALTMIEGQTTPYEATEIEGATETTWNKDYVQCV